ncbi:hypothetical protein, partial [Streptomyces sp. SID3343]|uniref:hypothetical protein n=1 Tax=Streptomyces sp. SID3343 TaxID=2690260 RepID=UPI0013C04C0C
RGSLANGGEPLADVLARLPETRGHTDLAASAHLVAAAAEYGGGPGPRALDACLRTTRQRLGDQLGLLRALRLRWNGYGPALDAAVAAVRGTGVAAGATSRRATSTTPAPGLSTTQAPADGRTTR